MDTHAHGCGNVTCQICYGVGDVVTAFDRYDEYAAERERRRMERRLAESVLTTKEIMFMRQSIPK